MLLRSLLFVPAYNVKFLDSALRRNADALIFDLEDSVPLEYKSKAREILNEYLKREELKNKKVFIRLNSIESGELSDDLDVCIDKNVNGFMVPKIYTSEDIDYYDKLISKYEFENGLEEGYFKILPLIETTSAILDVYNIVKASKRILAICFGGEDFLDDLHGTHGEPPHTFNYPRAKIALAARSVGVLPIDTPYLDLHDDEGFMKEEGISFDMGFAGCLLIHPSQIELANRCFMPDEEEVEQSKKIFDAIKEAEKKGSGVAMLDGKMIGPPMRKRAEKVLELVRMLEEGD